MRASQGLRWNARAFSLQAVRRADSGEARFGFTVTKKTGNAVERARMRRRLKEAIRTGRDLPVRAGHDYVFVARRDALVAPFAELFTEVARALGEMGAKLDRKLGQSKNMHPAPPMKAADRL